VQSWVQITLEGAKIAVSTQFRKAGSWDFEGGQKIKASPEDSRNAFTFN
jgi:hypothetical protein